MSLFSGSSSTFCYVGKLATREGEWLIGSQSGSERFVQFFPPGDKYVITFVLTNGGSFSSSQFAYDATVSALIVSWLVS